MPSSWRVGALGSVCQCFFVLCVVSVRVFSLYMCVIFLVAARLGRSRFCQLLAVASPSAALSLLPIEMPEITVRVFVFLSVKWVDESAGYVPGLASPISGEITALSAHSSIERWTLRPRSSPTCPSLRVSPAFL
jgi:hypothetical protein